MLPSLKLIFQKYLSLVIVSVTDGDRNGIISLAVLEELLVYRKLAFRMLPSTCKIHFHSYCILCLNCSSSCGIISKFCYS